MIRIVAVPILAACAGVFLCGCGGSTSSPAGNANDTSTSQLQASTTAGQFFTEIPADVPLNPDVRCVDAELPNITVDEAVTYRLQQQVASGDPTPPETIAEQRRYEWFQGIETKVPPGGDAAYAHDVCGLSIFDGAAQSGTPKRGTRGQVVELGHADCDSIADMGTRDFWDMATRILTESERAPFEYRVHSAITRLCPQLADQTESANQPVDCSKVTPDPSAKPNEGVWCTYPPTGN